MKWNKYFTVPLLSFPFLGSSLSAHMMKRVQKTTSFPKRHEYQLRPWGSLFFSFFYCNFSVWSRDTAQQWSKVWNCCLHLQGWNILTNSCGSDWKHAKLTCHDDLITLCLLSHNGWLFLWDSCREKAKVYPSLFTCASGSVACNIASYYDPWSVFHTADSVAFMVGGNMRYTR